MPVIAYVRVSTPHPQWPAHPKPTLTRRRSYHHDDRRTLSRSQHTEHGYHASATGGLTGGYGWGGRRVYRTAAAPRPSSEERCRGSCHGGFAWAPEGGVLLRQRALNDGVPTPHPRHAHPLSGSFQPGDHRFAAAGLHRHSRHLRRLAEALPRRFPHLLGAKQSPANTRGNPVGLRKDAVGEPPWNRLPGPEFREEGIREGHLDRPRRKRRRDGMQGGELTTVRVVSPDRLARHSAPPWRLLAKF
jgi:hypothetical protein